MHWLSDLFDRLNGMDRYDDVPNEKQEPLVLNCKYDKDRILSILLEEVDKEGNLVLTDEGKILRKFIWRHCR